MQNFAENPTWCKLHCKYFNAFIKIETTPSEYKLMTPNKCRIKKKEW